MQSNLIIRPSIIYQGILNLGFKERNGIKNEHGHAKIYANCMNALDLDRADKYYASLPKSQ